MLEYFEKRARFVMRHPFLCLAFVGVGWIGASVIYSERIEVYRAKLEVIEPDAATEKMKELMASLDSAIVSSKQASNMRAVAGLQACQLILPDLVEHSSDTLFGAAKELSDAGCSGEGANCQIPNLTRLLDAYMLMRDQTRIALGLPAEGFE